MRKCSARSGGGLIRRARVIHSRAARPLGLAAAVRARAPRGEPRRGRLASFSHLCKGATSAGSQTTARLPPQVCRRACR
eukprot:scaffold577_cov405-Prasinococcus_capsulatus_cf.AAC.24